MSDDHTRVSQPFAKVEIKITFDPTTSAINIDGPDLLAARTMYDFIFREIDRMTLLAFIEKAQGARVVGVGAMELPGGHGD